MSNESGKLKSFFVAGKIEAGCDEAGRGCLAGPVFAAAVILPPDFQHALLNDSKKLSNRQRMQVRHDIIEIAESWAVAKVDHRKIDEINIANASIMAMHEALKKLHKQPEHIIVDGNRFHPFGDIPHQCIIKGDGKYLSIAAASVLAKTYRDEFMIKLSKEFPHYRWDKNKGYPTRQHREAIRQYGPSLYHRRSYNLLDTQINIQFPD